MSDFRLRLPNPVIPDYSVGIRALDEGLDYRRERQRQLAKDAEYKRQNDISTRRLEGQEMRERAKYETDTADRNSELSTKVSALAREGRVAEAEALARASQYVDPRTGKQRSVGFDRGGDRFDPNFKRLELHPQLAEGGYTPGKQGFQPAIRDGQMRTDLEPAWTPETSPVNYEKAGKMLQMRPPGGDQAAAGDGAPSPYAGMSQFQLREPDVKAPPSYEGFTKTVKPNMTLPDGSTVELDPEEGERTKLRRAADTAQRLREKATAPETSPAQAQVMLAEANRLEAMLPGASAQHLRGREMQDDNQEFKAGESAKYQLTAEQKLQLARERAARAAAKKDKKPGEARAETKLDLQITAAGRMLAKDIAGAYSYRESQVQNHKFNQMAGALSASPNAALDSVTAGSFVKMAQGGSGVISDQDMEVFWKRIGGVPDRSWQWVENVISGKIQPEKRAEVLEAVQWLAGSAKGKLDEVRDAMEFQFMQDPVLKDRADQFVGAYFGDARKDVREGRGPQAKAAGAKAGAGAGDAGTAAKLKKWAAEHPGDLRAKAIQAKYGGGGG